MPFIPSRRLFLSAATIAGSGLAAPLLAGQSREAAVLPRYLVAGTGLRHATASWTIDSPTFVVFDQVIGTPPWPTLDLYFFFPLFFCPTGTEVATTATVLIEGISIVSGADPQVARIDEGRPSMVDPAVAETRHGKWVRARFARPITANSAVTFRFAHRYGVGTIARNRPNRAGVERQQGGNVSATHLLTGGPISNLVNKVVRPSAMMARAGDRQRAVLALGDSIGYGQDAGASATFLDDRSAFGFLELGMDEATASKRVALLNWCIPGWSPQNHADPAVCARQIWTMRQAIALNGGEPPFDQLICQHGTNGLGAGSAQALIALYALWRNVAGVARLPITQIEMLPHPTSIDGFASLEGQAAQYANGYPAGARWRLNAEIGGPAGLGDPRARFRAAGYIQDSIAPWRLGAYDTGAHRDKLKVLPFATTLAEDWAGGPTAVMAAAPAVGMSLVIDGAAGDPGCGLVTAVAGDGPYRVGLIPTRRPITARRAGSAVRDTMHGGPRGLHPSPNAHRLYARAVSDWKNRHRWS